MKVNEQPAVKDPYLARWMREAASKINLLSAGYVQGASNTATAAPTAGDYSVGDFVRNSAPAEAGTAGSRYVTLGWICTVAGSPGTFLPCRVLTGN